jgi:hypothetical protein
MTRPALLLLPLLLLLPTGEATAQQASDPAHAVVRIKSHGASATVIATEQGRSWVLGCCHMFFNRNDTVDPRALMKPLKFDGFPQSNAPARLSSARVIAFDSHLDLSLLEVDNGPFWAIPVAPPGHRPRTLVSLGYDEMKWPITQRSATLISTQGNTSYTREMPWHGRSGGGLIDSQALVLVGVVQGYETGPPPYQRGLYVSHDAILRFLAPHMQRAPGSTHPAPQPPRYITPQMSSPLCPPGGS